jgi:hypothetical protein
VAAAQGLTGAAEGHNACGHMPTGFQNMLWDGIMGQLHLEVLE